MAKGLCSLTWQKDCVHLHGKGLVNFIDENGNDDSFRLIKEIISDISAQEKIAALPLYNFYLRRYSGIPIIETNNHYLTIFTGRIFCISLC